MKPLILVLLCLAFGAIFSSAEKFDGVIHVDRSDNWFLGRFAFDYIPNDPPPYPGQIHINLDVAPTDASKLQGLEVLLYDDQSESWPEVYGKDLTCQQWREKAKNYDDITQDVYSQYKVVWSQNLTFSSDPLISQQARPRFWYVTLSTCTAPTSSMPVNFHLHFINLQYSSWDEEFGVNEQGLNTLFVVFFIFYTLFLVVHFCGVRSFWSKQNYIHPLIKLFASVLVFQYIFILFKMIHFVAFSSDGKGVPALYAIGDVIQLLARVIFILIIMLLALGWTISSETLQGRFIVVISVIVYSIVWIAILIWQLAVQDPADVELPLPLRVMFDLLLAFWFLFAIWFGITIFYNWRREDNPVKKTLYGRMGLIYGFWFVALPVATAISYATDPWVREKIVVTVSVIVSTLAYIVMAFLLWPSRAEEYFAVDKPNVQTSSLNHYEHL